jgi:predicted YcjX-like family ATPase
MVNGWPSLSRLPRRAGLLQQLIQDAWQNAAFEGISMDCLGLASIQATQSVLIHRDVVGFGGGEQQLVDDRRKQPAK